MSTMTNKPGLNIGWRIAAWGGAAALMMVPAIGVQISDEWQWNGEDFIFAGGLLLAACIAFEIAGRQGGGFAYRAASALAIAGGCALIVVTGAVGFIGDEGNPANLMFGAVLAAGLIGAAASALRPRGMANTLFAMAGVQAVIAAVALAFGYGREAPQWPLDILAGTGLFVTWWTISGLLYRNAAAGRSAAGHDEPGTSA